MSQHNPPRWAIRLFRWLCNDHLSDAVLGDMLELYDRRRPKVGKLKADLFFIWNVIQFIQPFAIRRRSNSSQLNSFDMLTNYFKIAWRSMSRQKLYTTITVGGFAIGLATCMVIFLFIKNELSYDKHYKDNARIFRLYNDFNEPGDRDQWPSVPTPLVDALRQDFPDIELAARIVSWTGLANAGENYVRRDDVLENTFEQRFAFADPDILEILEVPMVFGNQRALDKPYSMVISRRKAQQYFGDTDPRGKIIILNDNTSQPYVISGVMEDYRRDSHFQQDFILTLKGKEFWPGEQTNWCCWNYYGYVKLREGVNPLEFEKKMLSARDKYLIAYMQKQGQQDAESFINYHSFKLQPVSDIYINSDIGGSGAHGDLKYIYLFGGIAVFILTLACINFINLSTAKSANRAKEVGLRKVVGSFRKSIIAQFLTESVLYSMLSFVIALIIVWIALPAFNVVAARNLIIPWSTSWFIPSLVASALLIGMIAGVYPAFYLSAFQPIQVLKGNLRRGTKNSAVRSVMVVFQFAASIILIIGTFVIQHQMDYLMHLDTGFDKEQLMIIEGTATLGKQQASFRNELMKISDVENVSITGYIPVEGGNREGYAFYIEGRETKDRSVNGQKWRVDPYYMSTMKMRLVEGRDFNPAMPADSQAIIINQAMAAQLGLKDPVGTRITNGKVYTIIGVVADFNFSTMKAPIDPLSFVMEGGGSSSTSVRIQSSDLPGAIEKIESVWKRMMPNQPFRYSFLDERFAHMYDDVLRLGRIFAAFATLAIVVACLGLFALSAFMIEQRAKEVSIRLVMGASVQSIFKLLTTNFMKLVAISWIVGTPLAWYGMNLWLQDFTYRQPIAGDILIISGLIAGSIALITISYQSIKAGVINPIKNLRNE
jgi:putative ABC transport system permease protein